MSKWDHLRTIRGTQAKIAAVFGITRGAVAQWSKVPAERVVKVAEITGTQPHELRPDVFPEPQPQAAA